MPTLQANLEDILHLREVLIAFVHRQGDALDSANDEIRWTVDKLDGAREDAESRVDICNREAQECHRRAVWAAQMDGWIDCSPYMRALEDAEDRLAEVIRAQADFERAVDAYKVAHYHIADVLDTDAPRAVAYLDALLDGMEAYLAVRLLSTPLPTPQKAYRSGELPIRPTEGPITPAERREGDYGGPGRKG
jgi:hypothetical protein